MTDTEAEESRLHKVGDELAADEAAASERVELAAALATAPASGWKPGPRAPVVHVPPTVAEGQKLLTVFQQHLLSERLDFDASTRLDLLASYLSSQLLLFAGPSGTGKSSAARALALIFCHTESRRVIDGRRQLIGTEDVAGYFSSLSRTYVRVPELKALQQLAVPAADASPVLVVEEINLSPIEGYLGPFVHGMSGPSVPEVVWDLHDAPISDPPRQLAFAPYPRLLGTINVDATAIAPAPKVVARACVVLLEPALLPDATSVLQQLKGAPVSSADLQGAGASLVGDPREILETAIASDSALAKEVRDVLKMMDAMGPQADGPTSGNTGPRNSVSRRQLVQVLMYASWFVLLAEAHVANGGSLVGEPHRLGIENAVLHYILPSLPAIEFGFALLRLDEGKGSLANTGTGSEEVGALLRARVDRLMSSASDSFGTGRILDFWDRLS